MVQAKTTIQCERKPQMTPLYNFRLHWGGFRSALGKLQMKIITLIL